jgi:predicted secreted protein
MNARLFVSTLLALLFPALLHAKELTEKDIGKSVSFSAGNGIALQLAGNPTTGYGREIADIDRSCE